ncbi:MAG: hypothetical protein M3466_16385, partial [Gemmatimonadota bacterium]|nr:hypothetical protein [Gemmatimonadota bacterium]
MPWDVLWAPLASALASPLAGRPYTDQDVAWIRDKAGAYIIEALQAGQSVYRLYHQALADYFHNDELDQERQRWIARALIASVPEREGSKMWQEAHRYVLQHLSTHAARGGVLPELVRDSLYLLTADPLGLLPAIDSAISSLPAERTRVYKHTVHRLHHASLEEKAGYLELNARKQRVFGMAEEIAHLPLHRKWTPKWAAWRLSQTHTTFHGHED